MMLDCRGAGVEVGRKEEAGVDVSATWKGSRQLIRGEQCPSLAPGFKLVLLEREPSKRVTSGMTARKA